ncbi:MAG: type II toxin-antitoxin system VapC family toxin [Acidobacteria bacterium]|nr:type II toxin-antitoxin system VapC family toxin [Acidobacteriota bacterium]
MRRHVLDASVAVKWYLASASEPLLAEADLVLRAYVAGEAELIVPELFFAEFANVFWKAERQGRCDSPTSRRALRSILAFGLESAPTVPLLPDAVGIARSHGCSVYDGLYLAVAVERAATLITADQRLVAAVSPGLPVAWLGAFGGAVQGWPGTPSP